MIRPSFTRQATGPPAHDPEAGVTPSPVRVLYEALRVASPWLLGIIIVQAVMVQLKVWSANVTFSMRLSRHAAVVSSAPRAGRRRPDSLVTHPALVLPIHGAKVALLLHLLLGLLLMPLWQFGSIRWPLWCLLPWWICWPAQRVRLPELGSWCRW